MGLVVTERDGTYGIAMIGAKNLDEAQKLMDDADGESVVDFIPLDVEDGQIDAFTAVLQLAIDAGPGNSIEPLLMRIFEAGRNSVAAS
jgi:hypothetical protein